MQDTGSTSDGPSEAVLAPESSEALSAASDKATKAEEAQIAKANLQNQLMEQRFDQRKWAGQWILAFPAIHLLLNFALIVAQFCKLIELTEGMLYYMGAATTGSFVLLGFFARGLFFETPGQPRDKLRQGFRKNDIVRTYEAIQ